MSSAVHRAAAVDPLDSSLLSIMLVISIHVGGKQGSN